MKVAASRSRHTARAYQTAISLFLQYLDKSKGKILPQEYQEEWRPFASLFELARERLWRYKGPAAILRLVDGSVLSGFKASRERVGDSVNTIAQRIPAVRSFLSIAYRDGILTHEQAQSLGISIYRLKLKRDIKPVGRRLSPDEVRQLRAAVDSTTIKGKRDLAIIDTMLFLGLRREELSVISLSNFKVDHGASWLLLKGKGNKSRRLKIHPELAATITDWLRVRGGKLGERSGWLFISLRAQGKSNPIDATVVGKLIAHYGFKSSIAPEKGENILSPHDLRRTCARNAYDNGANLLLIQKMLGHSDVKTTANYIGAFEDDHNTAIDYVKY